MLGGPDEFGQGESSDGAFMTAGRLQDRVALVTGAARGIGLAAARKLAGEGARVLISDIDAAELKSAAQGLMAEGLQIIPVTADVSDRAAIARMVDTAMAQWGRGNCHARCPCFASETDRAHLTLWDE